MDTHRERVRYNHFRHSTATLFASLDVATDEVIAEFKPWHRSQAILSFLQRIDKEVPLELDDHMIVDNNCTHKHFQVFARLAQGPRFHVNYTPTYASWLNQVQSWFGTITQTSIRRSSYSSFKELIAKIEHFIENYNKGEALFSWSVTADSIQEKLQRLC